jgi:2-dehydro-3-deoxyphosphooctonate aldolase (KDO 8-P synthase)
MVAMTSRTVEIGSLSVGQHLPLALIAGPCAIESREHCLAVATELKAITGRLGMKLIFKSSFDKANRTSATSARGLGLEQGLTILAEVRETLAVPVLTDIHESWQCRPVAEVVDVLQIPAFLCRQTDLLRAAAETGRAINVKKGQFLAPWDMKNVARKLEEAGAKGILLTDRGTSFGYNTLVTDFRGLTYLDETGWPVVFDATHSVQQPGGQGGASGGERRFVPLLARAAVALGVASVFMESHDRPDQAISDGPNQVPLDRMEEVLSDLVTFDRLAKAHPLPKLA